MSLLDVTLRPVLICGPTASGKSSLALRVAERDGGTVVNADAAQVYGCWRVLTARPDQAALARAPHALYGHVPCERIYSVGEWLRDVAPLLDELARDGRRPIIVGGSGLYMSALLAGLVAIPPIPDDVREQSTALLAAEGHERLRRDLAGHDPATLAQLDANNPARLQRAWDVLMATGRGLVDWQRQPTKPLLSMQACDCITLHPEKHILNKYIEVRFRKMIQDGALEECRAYRTGGYSPETPAGRVLGARELIAYLDGRLGLEEAVMAAAVATRRFAKRQRTWFLSRMADWSWIDPQSADPLDAIPTPG